ncbi:hypothetical protein BGX33_001068 [Mortierella sp. NVP41]|nr:hypothetical protein BGX33_001068 [Mortierella sp. NVP41]
MTALLSWRIYPPSARTRITTTTITAWSSNLLSRVGSKTSVQRLTTVVPTTLILLRPAVARPPRILSTATEITWRRLLLTTKNGTTDTPIAATTEILTNGRVTTSAATAVVKPATVRIKLDPYARDWTLESNSALVELVDDGLNWSQISRALGKSKAGCVLHYEKVLVPFIKTAGQSTAGGVGPGAFSDLALIRKRIQEGKIWRQVAEEMGHPVEALRIRYRVLEPWLRGGMGHRSSWLRSRSHSRSLKGFAKRVDEVFEAMVKEEPGLTLRDVQEWFDQFLLNPTLARHTRIRQGTKDALLPLPTWTPEMDAKLLRMKGKQKKSWETIQREFGMRHEDCLRRYHYVREMRKVPKRLASIIPRPSIAQLHQSYDPSEALKHWSPEQDELIVKLKEEDPNWTWEEIATVVGIRRTLCYNRYYMVLLPLVKNRWNEENTTELHRLVGEGKSWKEISAALGFRQMACRKRWEETRKESIVASGERLAPSRWIAKKVEFYLDKQGRVERFYTPQDWNQLLDMTSRTASVQDWKRLQLEWLERHPAWSDQEENRLIRLVLRRGVGAWDEVAAALNTDAPASMSSDREAAARAITPAECRFHWKNLDMPVLRALDHREWGSFTRQSFWWSWFRHKDQQDRIMGGKGDGQFWNAIAQDLGIPGCGEQCLLFFENAIRDLVALDDRTIKEFADQRLQNLREMSRDQYARLRPKHWSVVLQRLVRQNEARLGRSTRIEAEWDGVIEQMVRYEQDSQQCDPEMDTGYPANYGACVAHWYHLNKDSGLPWSQAEVRLLEQGIRECGFRWIDIQRKYLPWRAPSMLRPQWYLIPDCAARISVDEYMFLLQAVEEQRGRDRSFPADDIDWSKVAAKMPPSWTEDPCRRVYEGSYRYLMESSQFTVEEDQWLLQNMEPQGDQPPKWKDAAELFPDSGKSAWQYRLRWCQLTDK